MLAIVLLTSCQTQGIATTADDACLIWNAIDYSGTKDTPETVAAIRVQNARHDSYCKAK